MTHDRECCELSLLCHVLNDRTNSEAAQPSKREHLKGKRLCGLWLDEFDNNREQHGRSLMDGSTKREQVGSDSGKVVLTVRKAPILCGPGVVTYVRKAWSPVVAEADCLGSKEEDLDQEGR